MRRRRDYRGRTFRAAHFHRKLRSLMPRLTILILAVALFMEQLDSTVIATSLPAIAADIGSDPIALKLALTSYFVALAIFIPISGWMADRFGARNIFRLAILVFVFGSIACAFSNSLPAFVVSRFFQGMGASMMTPVGRLLLVRSTPRNELVSAMAWLSIPALIGPICGPPLGGFLTTFLSWHWIFWINVPVGLAGILLAGRFLPATDARNPRPIDVVGFCLAALAFSGTVFGLSVISLPALPIVYGYLTIAVGIVAFLFYLLHARRTPFPLLDPKTFNYPLFRAAASGGNVFRLGIGAMPFLMPLMLQLGFGYSPFESGMITFVSAIGAIISKFFAERVYTLFGFRRVLSFGVLTSAIFFAINGFFSPETPVWIIMGALLIGGVIRSLTFTGVNALAYGDVEEADMSQATSINAVIQRLAQAFGIAIAGAILEIAAHTHGGPVRIADFHISFWIVAMISGLALIPFLRLAPDAGAQVSGHVRYADPVKQAN
jgi:EmrB/QacA subfamily drug resistance transporter